MSRKKRKKKPSIEKELDQILLDIDNIHICESILNDIEEDENMFE